MSTPPSSESEIKVPEEHPVERRTSAPARKQAPPGKTRGKTTAKSAAKGKRTSKSKTTNQAKGTRTTAKPQGKAKKSFAKRGPAAAKKRARRQR